jgi:multidrug resistance efflux pump
MKRKIIIGVIVILVVAAAAIFGLRYFMEKSHYVSTDNAAIGAPLIQVSSLSAGQVLDVKVNIGDRVTKQEVIAEVGMPRFSDPGSRQGYSATPGSSTTIEAPVSGYVAAVWTYTGALVGAGTPVITIYDDSNVWVTANVDENKVNSMRPGQPVEITIDSLGGKKLTGKVQAITPAAAASFSLLPSSNTSANFTKVSQVVAVRVALDNTAGYTLIPGSSVEVQIDTTK